MIDYAKRVTLKRIGTAGLVATAAGSSLPTFAVPNNFQDPVAESFNAEIADLELQTRVSSLTNDLEVVITNKSEQATRITQLTPSLTSTERGYFDFSNLLKDGDLELGAGKSVSVPMRPYPNKLAAGTDVARRSRQAEGSISAALKKSFSVITDNESFARVSIVDSIRMS